MSNLLESVRARVKALAPHSDMSVLKKSVDEQSNFLWANREIFIQAWVAETGIHPSQCMLVEKRSFDGAYGTMSISIVAKSQEQIDAEIEAAKPKPMRCVLCRAVLSTNHKRRRYCKKEENPVCYREYEAERKRKQRMGHKSKSEGNK